jgi:hypothetical protein
LGTIVRLLPHDGLLYLLDEHRRTIFVYQQEGVFITEIVLPDGDCRIVDIRINIDRLEADADNGKRLSFSLSNHELLGVEPVAAENPRQEAIATDAELPFVPLAVSDNEAFAIERLGTLKWLIDSDKLDADSRANLKNLAETRPDDSLIIIRRKR